MISIEDAIPGKRYLTQVKNEGIKDFTIVEFFNGSDNTYGSDLVKLCDHCNNNKTFWVPRYLFHDTLIGKYELIDQMPDIVYTTKP